MESVFLTSGVMAKWKGGGLQNPECRFESCWHHIRPAIKFPLFKTVEIMYNNMTGRKELDLFFKA